MLKYEKLIDCHPLAFLTTFDLTESQMAKFIVVHSVKVATEFVPETFGRLTTIGPKFMLPDNKDRDRSYQVCQCACGALGTYKTADMTAGSTSSCGCLRSDNSRTMLLKHGEGVARTSEWRSWRKMRERCNDPSHEAYARYGGRGIKVCDKWNDPDTGYAAFLTDMGRKQSEDLTVDRYPNRDGNYEPGNCRWATRAEQARNRRSSKYITVFGETRLLVEWCETYGVGYKCVHNRLRNGWPVEKALTTAAKVYNAKKNP